MPRKPRNSPRPAGRPRKAVAAVAAGVAAVERGELAPEDAAAAAGVARSTLYAARARQKLGGGVVAVKSSAAPASPSPATAAPPTPQGPALEAQAKAAPTPDGKPAALLALLAGVLSADAALVAALPLDADDLASLLGAVHLPPMPAERDPLALLGWVQAVIARDVTRSGEKAAQARKQACALLVQLATGTDRIQQNRPPETETPEAIVTRRLVEVRDAAVARIGLLTSAASSKLATDRADFAAWAGGLGPIGGEVVRRVDAMLGGA